MTLQAKKPPMSKESLLPLLTGHVLVHGLGQASLRPLAQAAGTSDRMLLYHFGTKEQLIADLISYVAAVYSAGLEAVIESGTRPTTRTEVLELILAQDEDPAMRPFMQLWWENVGGAARDLPGFRAAAQRMVNELLDWLERQMPEDDPDPAGGARFLLTVIEGTLMLSALGHKQTAREGLLAGRLVQA